MNKDILFHYFKLFFLLLFLYSLMDFLINPKIPEYLIHFIFFYKIKNLFFKTLIHISWDIFNR